MAHKELPGMTEKELDAANADLDKRDDSGPLPDSSSRPAAAVALRIAGANYSEIAETLGFASASHARRSVERSLAAQVGDESREQLRFLEARRLERLMRALWKKATNEKHDEQLAAARTVLAVIDRHARLYGLDAPQEMVIYTPAAGEIDAWVAQMTKQVRGEFPQEHDIIEGVVEAEYEDPEDEG